MLEKFSRQKLVLWSGHIVSTIFFFLHVVAISRIAGPEAMGIYVAAMTISAILVRLMDVGLPSSILFFIRMREDEAAGVAKAVLLHVLLMSPLAILAAYLLRYFPFESAAISDGVSRSLAAIALGMVFQLANALCANIALALKMYVSFAVVNTLPPVLMCLLLVGAYIGYGQADAADLFWMTALSAVVPLVWIAATLFQRIGRHAGRTTDSRTSMYQYGAKTVPGVAAKVFGQRLDRIVLSTTLTAGALSQYAVATTVRDGLLVPFNAYALGFMNDLMDLQKEGGSMYVTTRRISLAWFVSMSIAAAIASTLMPFAIQAVFGMEFHESTPVAQIVVLSSGFQCVTALYWTYFLAEGRPLLTSWMAIWSTVVLAIALAVAIPRWGLLGAGVALVLSAAISAATCIVAGALLQRTVQKCAVAS